MGIIWAIAASLVGPCRAAEEVPVLDREELTGAWGGGRQQLQDAGVEPDLTDIAETLSNPTGGIRQLTIYQGLLTASLKLDLEKLASWPGGSFFVDGYQISGRGLSRNAIGNLLTVSTIEALPSTRLHDLWLEQKFPDRNSSLRVGQIALDDEFYVSQYSVNFINSTFGCPDLFSVDLPGGGPCYPFAVPGARLRAAPTADLTLSVVAFNGDPAPPGPGDAQIRNSSGTNFLIGVGGFLTIAELAYAFDKPSDSASPASDIKFGGWYHTANFADLRRDRSGRSLADPTSDAVPAVHNGNFGLYGIVDKLLWKPSNAATPALAAFVRIGNAPPDRNLLSLEVDAGLTLGGPFPARERDMVGVAVSYGRVGNAARRLDQDRILFTGSAGIIRNYEFVLELSYWAQFAPWWVLQPDMQLVFHPGGRVAAPPPALETQPIPNALVLGVRSTITF